MGSTPKTSQSPPTGPQHPVEGEEARGLILHELEKILDSAPFRGSSRRKEFLSYVVRHSLDGRHEFLKERIIGAEVFGREADYATGEDPVVRVQAGEVRRRLEQYYYTAGPDVPVRIEIPIGSYCPTFHWHAPEPAVDDPEPRPPVTLPLEVSSPAPEHQTASGTQQVRRWPWVASTIVLALAVVALAIISLRGHKPASTALDQFWAPAFKSSQPVIICLAKPVVYRPSLDVYQRYAQKHPGTFQTEPERDNEVLPLDPSEKITWGEMQIYPGYGVASGDTYAAVQVSNLLVRMGKPSQVRIGKSYSFEDLRTSPAVVLGAFNNRWTMQMTSNLHFTLSLEDGVREQGHPERTWGSQFDDHGGYTADYGVVTRMLNARTGQFLVTAAGVGSPGTQAAGELITNLSYLQEALRNAPSEWWKKNLQVVVQTNVIDSIPGPPRVIAAYFW
jgi:hypothetical protein